MTETSSPRPPRRPSRFSHRGRGSRGVNSRVTASAQSQGFPVGPEPARYPSGVWKVLDERFNEYMIGNTPLVREWTGALWAEGPRMERRWPIRGLQRHPERRADAVGRGHRESDAASAARRTFPTATRSTSRAGSSRASTRPRGSCATSIAASRRFSPRRSKVSASTRRTTSSCIRRAAASCSPTRDTAATGIYEGTVRPLELPTSVYHIDPQNGAADETDR